MVQVHLLTTPETEISNFSVSEAMEMSNISSTPDLDADERHPILAVMGMLAFFSVIGTAGNAMVLYVYVRKRHKLAATIFIISLAATDFMTCVVIVPYTIAVEYLEYYVKYDFTCKLYMFFITSNVPFAAFIMVAIAVDRYLCICHPFMHLMNARRARIIILNLALLATSLGVITSLNYGVYEYKLIHNDSCWEHLSTNVTANFTTRVSVSNATSVGNITGNYYRNVVPFIPHSKSQLSAKSNLQDQTVDHDCQLIVTEYTGSCEPNEIVFSHSFVMAYQKVYAALFLVALLAVVVLYGMVYRSVLVRRAKRRRQRRSTRSVSLPRDSWYCDKRPSLRDAKLRLQSESGEERHPDVELARQLTIRERGLVANIRTAAILFVVTAMFIIAFLPAWLMAHEVVSYNMVVFYMYFIYNVANPIIYAFMNKAFRRDLRDVFDCKAFLRDFH